MTILVSVLLLSAFGLSKLLCGGKDVSSGAVGCAALLVAFGLVYGAVTYGSAPLALFVVATGLVCFLLFGLTTLRPLNRCLLCGHTWYPRGHDHSPRCPNCRCIR